MKKFKWLLVLAMFLVVLVPAAAFAQDYVTADNTANSSCAAVDAGTIMFIICRIALIINTLIPVLISLAALLFIWGIVQYVIAKDEEAKKRGKNLIIWGLVGLAVIVSVWALIAILKRTLGIGDEAAIQVVCVESPGIKCPE
ncbi:MAG TPA: hypothetical protein VJB09_01345 [Candidatus Paceibacterota bacterium]